MIKVFLSKEYIASLQKKESILVADIGEKIVTQSSYSWNHHKLQIAQQQLFHWITEKVRDLDETQFFFEKKKCLLRITLRSISENYVHAEIQPLSTTWRQL